MSDAAQFVIYTDGAARSNPGPAAIAYVIEQGGRTVAEGKKYLGETTNNIAEYTAVIEALQHARTLGAKRIEIRADSELMVKQLTGDYQVKNAGLKPLHAQADRLRRDFDAVSFKHIRRELNKRADELCNEALDEKLFGGAPPSKNGRKSATMKKPKPTSSALLKNVRAEAIDCLSGAAAAWSHGDPNHPSAEEVWDQLWSILEEAGCVK